MPLDSVAFFIQATEPNISRIILEEHAHVVLEVIVQKPSLLDREAPRPLLSLPWFRWTQDSMVNPEITLNFFLYSQNTR